MGVPSPFWEYPYLVWEIPLSCPGGTPRCCPGVPPPPEGTWDQRLGYPPRRDMGPETGVPLTWLGPETGVPPPPCPPVNGQTHWKHYLPSYFVRGRKRLIILVCFGNSETIFAHDPIASIQVWHDFLPTASEGNGCKIGTRPPCQVRIRGEGGGTQGTYPLPPPSQVRIGDTSSHLPPGQGRYPLG